MKNKPWTKVIQTLKHAEECWYFNVTPNSQTEMLQRFRFLLEHAPMILQDYAFHYSSDTYLQYLVHFGSAEYAWRGLQNQIEQKYGRIDNDSCSTLATIDDNPGTGRLIDKYVYQPIGQSIERIFLSLELRYFCHPENSAGRIVKFLQASDYSGEYIPIDEIWRIHFKSFEKNAAELCISLVMEISRKEGIVKAFQCLLKQASTKRRSLRVEAQKRLWSFCRYKNMILVLNVITSFESLIRDGYTTFEHCSPLDPDFQTHLRLRWEPRPPPMHFTEAFSKPVLLEWHNVDKLFYPPIRDILVACVRENRGFSSLPIGLVFEQYTRLTKKHVEVNEETAENLYLTVIAIRGFSESFPYTLKPFKDICQRSSWLRHKHRYCREGKESAQSDINVFELMVHSIISLCIINADVYPDVMSDLEYYTLLLNKRGAETHGLTEMEVRASETYLSKVSKTLVQRSPITFTVFKDIVSSPLSWERYHRPEFQADAKNETRVSFDYSLVFSDHIVLNPSEVFYYYIPFSSGSSEFEWTHFIDLLHYISGIATSTNFEGPRASWFRMKRWTDVLRANSVTLSGDRPGTALYKVMQWWRCYDVHNERKLKSGIQHELTDPDSPGPGAPHNRYLSGPEKDDTAELPVQLAGQFELIEQSYLETGESDTSLLFENVDSARSIAPHSWRYEGKEDVGGRGGEKGLDMLQPPSRKQMNTHVFEDNTSIAHFISTERKDDSPKSSYEDDTSMNEDFWSAKSIAELSILSIDD